MQSICFEYQFVSRGQSHGAQEARGHYVMFSVVFEQFFNKQILSCRSFNVNHHQSAHQIDVDLLDEVGARFIIESLIGEGTFGEVHKARDTAVSYKIIIQTHLLPPLQ